MVLVVEVFRRERLDGRSSPQVRKELSEITSARENKAQHKRDTKYFT